MEHYFVESLPKNCFYCDCCHTRDYDSRYRIDGEKFCGIENIEIDDCCDYDRPDWCPLKKIPEDCLSKIINV